MPGTVDGRVCHAHQHNRMAVTLSFKTHSNSIYNIFERRAIRSPHHPFHNPPLNDDARVIDFHWRCRRSHCFYSFHRPNMDAQAHDDDVHRFAANRFFVFANYFWFTKRRPEIMCVFFLFLSLSLVTSTDRKGAIRLGVVNPKRTSARILCRLPRHDTTEIISFVCSVFRCCSSLKTPLWPSFGCQINRECLNVVGLASFKAYAAGHSRCIRTHPTRS